ncbi:IKBKE family protein [Megaselia abdita]
MSFLRGSVNYVWCTTSVLGKGATGAVFQGVNKNTGESVAVKTFNPYSHMRPPEVQMREFEVLKKVNHENIVKLLAIEDDSEGRGKVIVMELCTGGSLFNILDDPENTYGLPEKEFLLVVEHLCAGMKHLRDNNIVHRDLKPGNIMKFISEDGQTVYKLTDFGAARELAENQPFASLYGTEEYLHPDLYERAVLRKSVNRSFTANVDLWSIGVTLFHVATGNLPFRPYGGRKNRETMHKITTRKTEGVISGIQTTENGPIEWSKILPAHCSLTEGLKMQITPLLAGLLENREKTWSFEIFFAEVTKILRKRLIHVFYINRLSSIEVFMEPGEQIDDFKEHLQLQTDVSPENQILLFNNEHIEGRILPEINASAFPETDTENPIFLYSKDNNNVQLPAQLELPKSPVFPSSVSVENDASLAKSACSVSHECKRRIEMLTTIDILVKKSVTQFVETLTMTMNLLLKKAQSLKELMTVVLEHYEVVTCFLKYDDHSDKEFQRLNTEIKELKTDFDRIHSLILQLHNNFVTEDQLNREWKSLMSGKKCPCRDRSSFKAKYLVERIRDSWQHLLRDRATRTLTYNDEQFHALEKIKVDRYGKQIKSLYAEDVKESVIQIADYLADWYKLAQTFYLKTQILTKDTRDCDKKLCNIREDISELMQRKKGNKQSVGALNGRKDSKNRLENLEIKKKLKIWQCEQEDLAAVLRQNNDLIAIMKGLAMSSNGNAEGALDFTSSTNL